MDFFTYLPVWPLPAYDPGVPLGWASTSVPLLLIEGTLDPNDPPYVIPDASAAFAAAHQQVVIVPNAVHVVLEHSAITPSSAGRPCGLQVIGTFLANPTGAPDTRCIAEVPPLDFRGDSSTANNIFGTSDYYE